MVNLTGHFIWCTLLVLGWTPHAFRTALILRSIDGIDQCFNVVYVKFRFYHPYVVAEIKTYQTRQQFSNDCDEPV